MRRARRKVKNSTTRRVPAPPKPATPGSRKRKAPATAAVKAESGFDDDGEARGGAAIRAELNARKAVGVACVVTRFYGGENIGKARFEHIRERTAAMLAAAGCREGVMVESDAWRGTGRTLGGAGGVDALAAALGGVPIAAQRQPHQRQQRQQQQETATVKGKGKVEHTQAATATVTGATSTVPARDIRQVMAEAAERRAQAAAAGSGSNAARAGETREVVRPQPPPPPLSTEQSKVSVAAAVEAPVPPFRDDVIDLCDDDDDDDEKPDKRAKPG